MLGVLVLLKNRSFVVMSHIPVEKGQSNPAQNTIENIKDLMVIMEMVLFC